MSRVVLSDLHLGRPTVNYKLIEEILSIPYNKIIINGDIIDYKYQNHLKNDDFEILDIINSLYKEGKLIYIRGNHEVYYSPIVRSFIKAPQVSSFEFIEGNQKFHIRHGHNFGVWGFIKKYHLGLTTKNAAFEFAARNKVNHIFIGHTHVMGRETRDNINYYNTGSFCEWGTAIVEIKNGRVDFVSLTK